MVKSSISILLFLFVSLSVEAASTPIDLNDFFFFTGDPVLVSASGDLAIISEDPIFNSIILSNDPDLGDPGVALPSNVSSLQFDYNFIEPVNNNDSFFAKVFYQNGVIIDDFSLSSTGSGTVVWDLTNLLTGTALLGLEFQLNAGFGDSAVTSSVQITNVQLNTLAAVPLPGALLLFGTGLFGVFSFQRKSA